jgi:CBS domain containing-hemolysin-like protein
MEDILLTLLVMAICLLAEGFFSGAEIGVVSADRIKLRTDAAKGSRGAQLAMKMLAKPEWLLSTTLVGTNIAVVTNTTMATALVIQLFGPEFSWLAVVLVAPLIWIFGEIVPKSIFQQRANSITPRAIFLLRFCSQIFYPILVLFSFFARLLARIMGDKSGYQNAFTLRQEIMTMMSMSPEEGEIDPHQQSMIRRLFVFGETAAREIMIPLIDVYTIDQDATCQEAAQLAGNAAHNILPVHAGRVDRIIGVLDTLDLIGVDMDQSIMPYVQPVDYVPGSRIIQDVLSDLRHTKREMAVVLDEFGGAKGIVTLEDIMEEVVKDIRDEYDINERSNQWVRKMGDRDYIVSGRMEPHLLAEKLSVELPEGHYSSVAGFLLEKARAIPREGSEIKYQNIIFTVVRATPQVIQEVRLRW